MPFLIPVHLFIGFFTLQIEKAEIPIRSSITSSYITRARSRQELDDLEERLSEHENRLLQMNNSHETMQRRYLELTELKHVLRETSDFFEEVCTLQNIFASYANCRAIGRQLWE